MIASSSKRHLRRKEAFQRIQQYTQGGLEFVHQPCNVGCAAALLDRRCPARPPGPAPASHRYCRRLPGSCERAARPSRHRPPPAPDEFPAPPAPGPQGSGAASPGTATSCPACGSSPAPCSTPRCLRVIRRPRSRQTGYLPPRLQLGRGWHGSCTRREDPSQQNAQHVLWSIGLTRKSFMPASMHIWRSRSIALAVMATMGRCANRCSLRISRVAVTPSITGICMSMKTRS